MTLSDISKGRRMTSENLMCLAQSDAAEGRMMLMLRGRSEKVRQQQVTKKKVKDVSGLLIVSVDSGQVRGNRASR